MDRRDALTRLSAMAVAGMFLEKDASLRAAEKLPREYVAPHLRPYPKPMVDELVRSTPEGRNRLRKIWFQFPEPVRDQVAEKFWNNWVATEDPTDEELDSLSVLLSGIRRRTIDRVWRGRNGGRPATPEHLAWSQERELEELRSLELHTLVRGGKPMDWWILTDFRALWY